MQSCTLLSEPTYTVIMAIRIRTLVSVSILSAITSLAHADGIGTPVTGSLVIQQVGSNNPDC